VDERQGNSIFDLDPQAPPSLPKLKFGSRKSSLENYNPAELKVLGGAIIKQLNTNLNPKLSKRKEMINCIQEKVENMKLASIAT